MVLTPARQRNAVSEGAALGLLLCGQPHLSFEKVTLDLAFESAWRAWAHRATFPQVSIDLLNKKDGYLVLAHGDRGKHVHALYWDRQGDRLAIRTRDPEWSAGHPADVEFALSVIGGGISRGGWVELAQDLLRRVGS